MTAGAAEPVFIGLGSNLANPVKQVTAALERLHQQPELDLRCHSSLYRSPPWGDLQQDEFINAVALIATSVAAADLLQLLQQIETEFGRDRSERHWGPRLLDLDLLAYGQQIINTADLVVPHPRIAERAFVLVPFAEIAPKFRLPGLGTINQLLTLRSDAGTIRRLE
jgi:2-amino-4-hydroxy-6-hydroxymethyldihydropteridine diphosphokinase